MIGLPVRQPDPVYLFLCSGVIIMSEKITEALFSMQDTEYRDFQSKLFPTVPYDSVIGVRTPQLRALASKLSADPDTESFLDDLPHRYFDENQLHAFIVSGIKDFCECMRRTEQFLPYIDNWATCDQFSPSVFGKHKDDLFERIVQWIGSSRTYTVRFAIVSLMRHYLDSSFDPSHLEMVRKAADESDEYYIRMAAAWYFATALTKQYETVYSFLSSSGLDAWTRNKAIQKATESRRLTPEQKTAVRALREHKA